MERTQRADESRENKSLEKESAIKGEKTVFTVDVETVLLSPYTNASIAYYKMKLAAHNYEYTVYDLASKRVSCYI